MYLVDEQGRPAPSLWTASTETLTEEEFNELEEKIKDIHDDHISTSLSDAKCPDHTETESQQCEKCEKLLNLVTSFQSHKCTFTCKKKNKFIQIPSHQGLGINDPESTDIITHVCRFNFPRFPLHKTCVLLSFSKNDDPKMVFEAKKDLKHIKQYLRGRS